MARRPMMAANWKMNKTVREAEYTATLLPRAADAEEDVDVVVCVPHTCLHEVSEMADTLRSARGAQNFYHEDSGAYTGEISAPCSSTSRPARSSWATPNGAKSSARPTRWSPGRRSVRWRPKFCPSSVSGRPRRRDAGDMWEKVSGQVERVIEELEDVGRWKRRLRLRADLGHRDRRYSHPRGCAGRHR